MNEQLAVVYAPGAVQRVDPVYVDPRPYDDRKFAVRAYQPTRYVGGAALTIPAPRDVHGAYLERVLTCHAASESSAHPNDPLHVDGVREVSVESTNGMLRVSVLGADRDTGREILQRARSLHSSVEVQQVAALQSERAAF